MLIFRLRTLWPFKVFYVSDLPRNSGAKLQNLMASQIQKFNINGSKHGLTVTESVFKAAVSFVSGFHSNASDADTARVAGS